MEIIAYFQIDNTTYKIYSDGEIYIDFVSRGKVYPDGEIWIDQKKVGKIYEDGEIWIDNHHVGRLYDDQELWINGRMVARGIGQAHGNPHTRADAISQNNSNSDTHTNNSSDRPTAMGSFTPASVLDIDPFGICVLLAIAFIVLGAYGSMILGGGFLAASNLVFIKDSAELAFIAFVIPAIMFGMITLIQCRNNLSLFRTLLLHTAAAFLVEIIFYYFAGRSLGSATSIGSFFLNLILAFVALLIPSLAPTVLSTIIREILGRLFKRDTGRMTVAVVIISIIIIVLAYNKSTVAVEDYANSHNASESEFENNTFVEDYDYDENEGDSEAVVENYILPASQMSYLREEDIAWMDDWTSRLAINEIYARHGRKFANMDIQNYFNRCSWYTPSMEPDDFQESILNEYEMANISLLREYRMKQGW